MDQKHALRVLVVVERVSYILSCDVFTLKDLNFIYLSSDVREILLSKIVPIQYSTGLRFLLRRLLLSIRVLTRVNGGSIWLKFIPWAHFGSVKR